MKAIILGGAGFIGSHLADALLKKNYKVKIIDNLPFPKNANYRKIKIKDYEQGRIIWSTFVLFFQPNLLSKLNLLKTNMTLFN